MKPLFPQVPAQTEGSKLVFSAMLSGTDKETKESEIQFSSLSRLEMEIVYN